MRRSPLCFPEKERAAVYRAIQQRRDIRHFIPYQLDDATLWRLLKAAHAGPSVGFMQPWDFIIIQDARIREQIWHHVLREKKKAGRHYQGKEAALYERFKLEGIRECSHIIAVTCDPQRGGHKNIGRVTMPQTALFSVCAAIQNFWLAARAEGLGVGWVSILQPTWLRKLLHIPKSIELVALLCVGATSHFPEDPLLQTAGWRRREVLQKLTHQDQWNRPYAWPPGVTKARKS